ncbi:MAG: tRNA 2-selenouridine(34) synthase MnmH [Cyanobacteria bacterium P01_H01_bin.15]
MPLVPQFHAAPWTETFSEIIDVRSPGEFAEDHLPGAINLPVLNDSERALVGTTYKQVSPFEARKQGAAIVSKNIGAHLSKHFANKPKTYRPLIYCWRGGQRSNSLALILTQIGWPATLLEGGYKTYRQHVRESLEYLPNEFTWLLIGGLTGSGKTYLLEQLAEAGEQVLDLEAIANHRGSLLGQVWADGLTPQPSQKWFESKILAHLKMFTPTRPVWVESESNKIGQVHIPPDLWQHLKGAHHVEIEVPLKERVDWLLRKYPHLVENPTLLKTKLSALKERHGKQKLAEWADWIDSGDWFEFVEDILRSHYDPAYKRSMVQTFSPISQHLSLPNLEPDSVVSAVSSLTQIAQSNNPERS